MPAFRFVWTESKDLKKTEFFEIDDLSKPLPTPAT